jgi:adenylylsulfate reductase, subunit B
LVTYPDECWHCSSCVLDCPAEGAISLRVPFPMMMTYK